MITNLRITFVSSSRQGGGPRDGRGGGDRGAGARPLGVGLPRVLRPLAEDLEDRDLQRLPAPPAALPLPAPAPAHHTAGGRGRQSGQFNQVNVLYFKTFIGSVVYL